MNLFKNPMKVLLADDDPSDHFMIKRALNGAPGELKINSVYNGMELLDYLLKMDRKEKSVVGMVSHGLPDIIITDLYMPFAGGLHVLKQIRRYDSFKTIPIYVFSSNYDMTVRTKVIENGATAFHQKPSDFESLQTIINSILEKVLAEHK